MSLADLATYFFWIGPAVVQMFIIWLMVKRDLRQEYPLFFGYTIYQVIRTVVLFTVYHTTTGDTYFFSYWTATAVSVLIGFAVIHEVFTKIFQPFDALHELAQSLIQWAGMVLVLVAGVLAVSSTTAQSDLVVAGVLALDRSVRVMQCGMVLFLLFLAPRLGLTWKHNVFGISLGFGIFAAVEMTAFLLYQRIGIPAYWASLSKSATYFGATLLWAWYMATPEPARSCVAFKSQPEKWNIALMGVQRSMSAQPATVDGMYLTSLERTVERVLLKSNGGNGHNGKGNGNGKH